MHNDVKVPWPPYSNPVSILERQTRTGGFLWLKNIVWNKETALGTGTIISPHWLNVSLEGRIRHQKTCWDIRSVQQTQFPLCFCCFWGRSCPELRGEGQFIVLSASRRSRQRRVDYLSAWVLLSQVQQAKHEQIKRVPTHAVRICLCTSVNIVSNKQLR